MIRTLMILMFLPALCFAQDNFVIKNDNPLTVEPGREVLVEYTVKGDDGLQIETTVGAEPYRFTVGTGKMIPALEVEIQGLKPGESTKVTLEADDAYGQIQQEGFVESPLGKIPENMRQVGRVIVTRTADGQTRQAKIAEIRSSTVVLDFNHPLAGKRLHFEIEILDVKEKK